MNSLYLASCVLNAFVSYTAIVLNIVTVQAIRKTPSLSKSLKILLLSLAVSDLAVGLMAAPLHVAIIAMKITQNTENNSTFDKTYMAFVFVTNLFGSASCLLITTLIADRFLSIRCCLRYQQLVTYKRVFAVVVLVWVVSVTSSLVSVFVTAIINPIVGVLLFVLATIVTFLSYKTYSLARRQMYQIRAMELTVQQTSRNGGELVNVAGLRKFAMAAVYVCVVFLVCYLPHMCVLLAITIASNPIQSVIYRYTLTLVFANSSLNPLIYCWKMRHIRQAAMNILRNACSRRQH